MRWDIPKGSRLSMIFCIETTDTGDKLNDFIDAIPKNDITEVIRSASIGIQRGAKVMTS